MCDGTRYVDGRLFPSFGLLPTSQKKIVSLNHRWAHMSPKTAAILFLIFYKEQHVDIQIKNDLFNVTALFSRHGCKNIRTY